MFILGKNAICNAWIISCDFSIVIREFKWEVGQILWVCLRFNFKNKCKCHNATEEQYCLYGFSLESEMVLLWHCLEKPFATPLIFKSVWLIYLHFSDMLLLKFSLIDMGRSNLPLEKWKQQLQVSWGVDGGDIDRLIESSSTSQW